MGQAFDLEGLREIFRDRRTHTAIGKIAKLEMAGDGSALWATCTILSQGRDVVARVAWSACSSGGGSFSLPVVADLVLLVFAEGDDDQVYVTHRLSSKEDFIPEQARAGHAVTRAHTGKELHLQSDTKVALGRPDAEPAEPLVLGTQLQLLLIDILAELAALSETLSLHKHVGNLGAPTSPPMEAPDFVANQIAFEGFSSSPVEDGEILSDISFTEK